MTTFDLGAAQEKVRSTTLQGSFLNGDDKAEMVRLRRPFYIHKVQQRTFTGNDGLPVDQWAYTIEFADVEPPEGSDPDRQILTLTANGYRDGLAHQMVEALERGEGALGPFKLIREQGVKGKPYDFDSFDHEKDSAPPEPRTSFRPRPQ